VTQTSNSCVVVGAGISGLLAACELQAAGWQVVVLDKGRGVGGRMATRRVRDGTFDHGAQFFTVRDERFGRLVEEWVESGVVEEWSRGFADAEGRQNEDGHPRYRGSESMTSVPEHLARGLDVRTGERVVEVNVRDGAWEARTGSGSRVDGAALLLTAPVPQSLALFKGGSVLPGEARRLEEISYSPCLALMALLDGPSGVPEPGGVQIKGEPLDWISDNQRKGISEAPALTIHAGPEWSREHFEADETWVAASLLAFAGAQLGTDLSSRSVETSLARWRYSWVTQPHPEPCFVAREDPPLLFAGDAFGPSKVEGAALSGLAAADRLSTAMD
jgi:predicted NAD/FAD-dependent oxidoreductase